MAVTRFGRAQKATALRAARRCSRRPGPPASPRAGSDASADEPAHTLPDGTRVPAEAIRHPPACRRPGALTPGVRGNARRVVVHRLHHRHPRRRPRGLPARRDRDRRRRHRPATCPGSWSPRSAAWSPTTAAPTATLLDDQGRRPARHLRHRARRHARHRRDPRHRRRPVRRRHEVRPRGRPDAVHPLDLVGRRASTPTATASATRRTSTTRRSPRPSTSAPATTTCRPTPGAASRGLPLQPQPALRRPGAVDHARLHSTATSPRCRTAPPPPAHFGTRPGRDGRQVTAAHGHARRATTATTGGAPRRRPRADLRRPVRTGADHEPQPGGPDARTRRPRPPRRRAAADAHAADEPARRASRPTSPTIADQGRGDRAVPGRRADRQPAGPSDACDQCVDDLNALTRRVEHPTWRPAVARPPEVHVR